MSIRLTSCSPPLFSHLLSSARCLTFLRNSFLRLSCAASRFCDVSGFGFCVPLDANLNMGLGAEAAGLDWTSRAAFAPLDGDDLDGETAGADWDGEGGVEARMGLEDSGEEMVGR